MPSLPSPSGVMSSDAGGNELQMDCVVNVSLNIIKILEENSRNSPWFRLGRHFTDNDSKSLSERTKELDVCILKTFKKKGKPCYNQIFVQRV